MEYTHGAEFTWEIDAKFDMPDLYKILDDEFSGWRPANQEEDFNGQTIYIVMCAVAFLTSEEASVFILKYGERFGMLPTTNLSFEIKCF